jgi:hypothetical protein
MREGGSYLRFLLADGLNTAVTCLMSRAAAGDNLPDRLCDCLCQPNCHQLCGGSLVRLQSAAELPLGADVAAGVLDPISNERRHTWAWLDLLFQHPMLAPATSIVVTLPLTCFLSTRAFV